MAKEPTKLDLQAVVEDTLDPALTKVSEAFDTLFEALQSFKDVTGAAHKAVTTVAGKTADSILEETREFKDVLDREIRELTDKGLEVLPGEGNA